jgi:sodium/hydrogen antiporter
VQILTVGTAALAYGLAVPIGGSGFIAAFVGGFVFGIVRRGSGGEVSHLLDEGGQFLNGVTFVVFGAAILGSALANATWEAVVYAVLSLTVIRMLPVAVSLLGSRARPPTIAFLGWFGPRGLASIVFGVIVVEEAELPHTEPILLAASLTIGLSVFAHGLSAQPLTRRYAEWYRSHPRRSPARDGERAGGRAPLALALAYRDLTRGPRSVRFPASSPVGLRACRTWHFLGAALADR